MFDSLESKVPEAVMQICRTLCVAGNRGFVVGGAVRDALRGAEITDFDLATTATPQKMLELFPKVIPTGIKHGTVTVMSKGHAYEVTTLRGEAGYSDGRHPDSVTFIDDIEADLARRDFTVNAMAWDPLESRLYDPFGGRADLEKRLIRAVGEPGSRFDEDGLRLMRAARFAAALEFRVHEDTLRAMPCAASRLDVVSAERKRDELFKLLLSRRPSVGLRILEQGALALRIDPSLGVLAENPTRWEYALRRVDRCTAKLSVRLAACFCQAEGLDEEVGGPKNAKIAAEALRRLKSEKKLEKEVAHLVSSVGFAFDPVVDEPELRRLVRDVGRDVFDEVIDLRRADIEARRLGGDAILSLGRFAKRAHNAVADAPLYPGELAVNGALLMSELGIEPGPELGALIADLMEVVIDHPELNSEARLLARAVELRAAPARRV